MGLREKHGTSVVGFADCTKLARCMCCQSHVHRDQLRVQPAATASRLLTSVTWTTTAVTTPTNRTPAVSTKITSL